MQSSYSLIKSDFARVGANKTISTEYKIENPIQAKEIENIEEINSCYENVSENILEHARRQSEEIVLEAMNKAKDIEKAAYEEGYKQGLENGFEDGKNQAIERVFPVAEAEANALLKQAEELLLSATKQFDEYMDSKREELIALSLAIATKVAGQSLTKSNGIDELVEEAIMKCKGEESIIIKCNTIHKEALEEKIPSFKASANIIGQIFIFASEDMEAGNAIIQRRDGSITVGIDVTLNEIKRILPVGRK